MMFFSRLAYSNAAQIGQHVHIVFGKATIPTMPIRDYKLVPQNLCTW
jgi:hypothetical protein